jgi:hypothetical protein
VGWTVQVVGFNAPHAVIANVAMNSKIFFILIVIFWTKQINFARKITTFFRIEQKKTHKIRKFAWIADKMHGKST